MKNDGERAARLREMARSLARGGSPDLGELAAGDIEALLHELAVYQAELETQNEELRSARLAVEAARDRYRDLYDFAPVGYFTLDREGTIVEANLTGCDLLATPRQQLLGQPLDRFFARAWGGPFLLFFDRTLAGESREGMELLLAPPAGERWVLVEGRRALDGAGGTVCRLILTDVTSRRQAEAGRRASEARFRTFAELSPLGMFECDAAGRFLWVNRRWEALSGLANGRSLDFGWNQAIHPDDRRKVIGHWLAGSDRPWEEESRLRRPDGSEFWVRILVSPLGGRQGKASRFLGTVEEITERRRYEEGLRQAKAAAEDASRAKSEFLANMSHEIRTPMTVILGALEQLQHAPPELREELLRMAESSAGRLLTLIDDILDFSRIEARRLEVAHEPYPLREAVDSVVSLFRHTAERKGVALRAIVAADLPERIVGDHDRLGQVLINLLGNALKFTEAGEVELTVEKREGEGEIAFTVRDTGIGIPAEKLEAIFDSFSQVDPSRTRRYGGSGLGLAVSKGLVELMGGTIRAESAEGEGSRFTFTLPLAVPLADADRPQPEEAEAAATRGTVRILLAEDDAMVSDLLGMILRRRGWEVEVVPCGRQAMERSQAVDFDLILMDVQMPTMDGLAAARAIRSREAHDGGRRVPIIALTAHARPEDREEALTAGVDGWLAKPVGMEQLYKAVEEQLQKR